IRVAQYQPGYTRVVLEVADVSDYSAFLLPNPYRLIIDIHGRQPHSKTQVAKLDDPARSNLEKTGSTSGNVPTSVPATAGTATPKAGAKPLSDGNAKKNSAPGSPVGDKSTDAN